MSTDSEGSDEAARQEPSVASMGSMGSIQPSQTPHAGHGLPKLAIASLSLGTVGLVLAVSTWAAWLLVLPQILELPAYRGIVVLFYFVLGALWFAVLPVAALALIFSYVTRHAPGGVSPLGRVTGMLALAAALAGAIVFVAFPAEPPPFEPYLPFPIQGS